MKVGVDISNWADTTADKAAMQPARAYLATMMKSKFTLRSDKREGRERAYCYKINAFLSGNRVEASKDSSTVANVASKFAVLKTKQDSTRASLLILWYGWVSRQTVPSNLLVQTLCDPLNCDMVLFLRVGH